MRQSKQTALPAEPDQGGSLPHQILLGKMHRIRLLLSTMDDYLPGVSGSMPEVPAGPSASRFVPCDFCLRNGRLKDGRLCPECRGEGWRTHRAGEKYWDRYLEEPVDEAVAPTRQFTGTPDRAANIRRLDASIERIQRVLQLKEGKLDEDMFGWERMRAAYEDAGSYRELRKCLAVMEVESPRLRRVLRRRYEVNLFFKDDEVKEHDAIFWLAMRMPKVVVPSWVMEEEAQKARDTVESLAAQGFGAGTIARKLRISKKKVRRILKKINRS